MDWKLNKSRPICPQICEQISTRIALGELRAGEQLPSVRTLALEAGVNPGTVQKAFEQLSRDGIVYSMVGSGWYVGDRRDAAETAVERARAEKTETYFSDMENLGMSEAQIKDYIERWNTGGRATQM